MPTSLYQFILLIDDDNDDREIFMEAVKEIYPDIQIQGNGDGELVLDLLFKNEMQIPDLFFVDLNMPKINGKEVLRKLKNDEVLKNVPVIMFSTFFAEKDIKEFNSLGAVHHILKSTNFTDLRRSLEETLSKKW